MDAGTFGTYKDHCIDLANGRFNFIKQMNLFKAFLTAEI